MAYATNEERKALKDSNSSFDACPFVVRFKSSRGESELVADDIDHALTLQKQWIDHGCEYVEIFRVLFDGSLNATIGAYYREV